MVSRFLLVCVVIAWSLHLVGDSRDPFRDDWAKADAATAAEASDVGSMGVEDADAE